MYGEPAPLKSGVPELGIPLPSPSKLRRVCSELFLCEKMRRVILELSRSREAGKKIFFRFRLSRR